MGIALTNRQRRLPTVSIEVEDLLEGRPIEKRCYFLKLPAGRTQETAYRHTIARRGVTTALTGLRLCDEVPVRPGAKASREVASADRAHRLPGAGPRARPRSLRGLPVRQRGGRQRAAPPPRRPTSSACATSGRATIRATSTGARRRAAGTSRPCARTRPTTASDRHRRARQRGGRRARARSRSPVSQAAVRARSRLLARGLPRRARAARRDAGARRGPRPGDAHLARPGPGRSRRPRRRRWASESRAAPEKRDGTHLSGRVRPRRVEPAERAARRERRRDAELRAVARAPGARRPA